MSKLNGDDIYACFRCGGIHPPVKWYNESTPVCGSCNEDGLVTLTQALDMLNHYYVVQQMNPLHDDEYTELIKDAEEAYNERA